MAEILIADDDDFSRLRLQFMLEKMGHEVRAASEGDEALRLLLAENAPKLAILDVMMPGHDGVEVCRRVREHTSPLHPYIILLTAKDRREDVIRGFKAGASDYITKPFDSDELAARVRVGVRMMTLQ